MAKYRKKPVIVEAMQWTGKNTTAIYNFCPSVCKIWDKHTIAFLIIPTLEGDHKAEKFDWIIKGVKGEFYPIKNDIFLKTYEKVID